MAVLFWLSGIPGNTEAGAASILSARRYFPLFFVFASGQIHQVSHAQVFLL